MSNKIICSTRVVKLKPPQCKNCKYSVKFNEDIVLCTKFKIEEKYSQFYDLNNYIDTEMARGIVQFCGPYGIYFEPK